MASKFAVTYFFDECDFVVQEMIRASEGAVMFEVGENMNKRFFGFRDTGGHWIEVVTEKVRRFRIVAIWSIPTEPELTTAVPAS